MLILNFSSVRLQDKEPRGIIPLENLSVQKVDDPKKPVGVGVGPEAVAAGRISETGREERAAGLSRRLGMPSTPSWELRVASVSLLGPWTLCLPLHLSQEAGLGQLV